MSTTNSETGDLVTGLPRGVVTEAEFVDSLRVSGYTSDLEPAWFGAAWNRPGTYALSIEREGFQRFVKAGLVASEGPCGVESVVVTAALIPE